MSALETYLKGCYIHAEGKPCMQVISEGNCQKEKCKLFPKVLKMIPKFKRLYELQSQGVVLTTIWDFSEKGMRKIEERKKKAQKWLSEVLPKIEQNLKIECG